MATRQTGSVRRGLDEDVDRDDAWNLDRTLGSDSAPWCTYLLLVSEKDRAEMPTSGVISELSPSCTLVVVELKEVLQFLAVRAEVNLQLR